MPVKCDDYERICVISIEGDLAGENVMLARQSMEQRIDQQHVADFVVDLQKSPFIDSEGLEALLSMKRRSEELFGQFKLVNLDEHCTKILEITRLEHQFECHPDLEAALKTMS